MRKFTEEQKECLKWADKVADDYFKDKHFNSLTAKEKELINDLLFCDSKEKIEDIKEKYKI